MLLKVTDGMAEGQTELQMGWSTKVSTKTYVVTPHWNRLNETVLMMGHKICFYGEIWLIIPKLSMLFLIRFSFRRRSNVGLHCLHRSLHLNI